MIVKSLGGQFGQSFATPSPSIEASNQSRTKWYESAFLAVAFLAGVFARAHCVLSTPGTYDVDIWQQHAAGVYRLGLIEYYHSNPEMNHPPLMSLALASLWKLSDSTQIPFRFLLRAPFALLDLGTALILVNAFKNRRTGFFIAACYFAHPLSIIYSSYHGNTDTAIGFFALLSCVLIAHGRILWAGLACAICLNIKLPIGLIIPAFLFAIRNAGDRLKFLSVTGTVALIGYLPALMFDPMIVLKNVVGYQGQFIHTTDGIPVWGAASIPASVLLARREYLATFAGRGLVSFLLFWLNNNLLFVLIPIMVFSFWRRRKCELRELLTTVNGVYAILFGLTNCWSFQYFAWSLPFWFAAPRSFSLPATVLAGSYIYGLYWLLCGDPWLIGAWNFEGHPRWPTMILELRNLTVIFFFCSAISYMALAYRSQLRLFAVFRGITSRHT